jgi:hypothetical protein
MLVFGVKLLGNHSSLSRPNDPYWNKDDPSKPRYMEIHTELWRKVLVLSPQITETHDVFRRVKTLKNGITWTEDIPVTGIP